MCRVHRTSALRRRVAEVAPVGGGLFVLGVSAYVVLGAAGHTLAPGDYAAVASLYLLVAITSPGVFTALKLQGRVRYVATQAEPATPGPVTTTATTILQDLAARPAGLTPAPVTAVTEHSP